MTLYLARYLLPITGPPIEDGALLVNAGRIVAVGRRVDLQAGWAGETRDFGDAVILPPLTNAHTHLELTRFPEWVSQIDESSPPQGFVEWILHLVRIKRRQSVADLRLSLAEGLQRSLEAGTGAIGDILACHEAFSTYRTSPLLGRIFLEVLGVDEEQARGRLSLLETILYGGSVGCLAPGLAPHAPYTLSASALQAIRTVAGDTPLSIHLAESAEEDEFLLRSAGAIAEKLYPAAGWQERVPPPRQRRSVEWLEDQGILSLKPLLVHGVRVTREDTDLLRKRGVTVVLCPRSNHYLQVGQAPVEIYRDAGVPLALGTDSLASCPSLSVWDELAFADQQFGHCLSPRCLLAMATCNGAEALGLRGEMGALESGWGAHFQVVRFSSAPVLGELEACLTTRGEAPEGRYLFLNGRQVL